MTTQALKVIRAEEVLLEVLGTWPCALNSATNPDFLGESYLGTPFLSRRSPQHFHEKLT